MKILLLTDADVWAGTERHLAELAWGLREVGAHPMLAAPANSPLQKRALEAEIPFKAIAKRGFFDPRVVLILARRLSLGRCDIIHAHNGRTHLHAVCALKLARRGAVVFTQHFITPHHARSQGPKAQVFKRIHRVVNSQTNAFIAISHAVEAAMLARSEAPSHKITVVPNGIADPLPLPLVNPQLFRTEWEIPTDAPFVVCLARLEVEKGLDVLVEAWRYVHEQMPNARLMIGGRGSMVSDLQKSLGNPEFERTVILPGFIEASLSAIRAADVFVLPSPAEPFGLVFLEAMALGKPVIACTGGAAPEIVVNEETGLLVPSGNARQMGTAILDLLKHPKRAHALGAQGRERFLTRFTRETMSRATVDVYRRALGNQSTQSNSGNEGGQSARK